MEKKVTYYEEGYLYNRIRECFENGDKEKGLALVDRLYAGTKQMHDGMMNYLGQLFTFVEEKLGEEAIGEAWYYMSKQTMGGAIEMLKSGDLAIEDFYDMMRLGTMCHFSEFTEVEDDEKWDTVVHSCGVCRNYKCNHMLDTQPGESTVGVKIGATKESHPWALGYKGMPYYCVHSPFIHIHLGKELGFDFGDYVFGRQYDDDGNPVDEPCHEIVYKAAREVIKHVDKPEGK